jgi:hypothetical protein
VERKKEYLKANILLERLKNPCPVIPKPDFARFNLAQEKFLC